MYEAIDKDIHIISRLLTLCMNSESWFTKSGIIKIREAYTGLCMLMETA
jgi:hypothetical protein